MRVYAPITASNFLFVGKTTFFVANQEKIPTLPTEELTALESEVKSTEELNKELTAEIKNATTGVCFPPLHIAFAFSEKLTTTILEN